MAWRITTVCHSSTFSRREERSLYFLSLPVLCYCSFCQRTWGIQQSNQIRRSLHHTKQVSELIYSLNILLYKLGRKQTTHCYLFLHLHYTSHHAQLIQRVQFWRSLLSLFGAHFLVGLNGPSSNYLVHPWTSQQEIQMNMTFSHVLLIKKVIFEV